MSFEQEMGREKHKLKKLLAENERKMLQLKAG
jgi:hypothetical protein